LRDLALIRVKEARVLSRTRNYDGAYYLSGYVVEYALKACIAKHTRRSEFPDKKTAVASHTHRLEDLIGVARLSEEFLKEVRTNLAFETNWNVAKDGPGTAATRDIHPKTRRTCFPQSRTKRMEFSNG
jgi:HEPN domain-containing protein